MPPHDTETLLRWTSSLGLTVEGGVGIREPLDDARMAAGGLEPIDDTGLLMMADIGVDAGALKVCMNGEVGSVPLAT